MGPTTKSTIESLVPTKPAQEHRVRRGSLPDLKTVEKKEAEKKVPTGPRANPLYKTRLCMNFQSTGSCPYTEKCQFAHGVKELEKWENWRNTHKDHEIKKDNPEEEEGRSRSQSMEKPSSTRTSSLDSQEFSLSPQSLNWELSTPVRPRMMLDDTPISSFSQDANFSLWSSFLDDLENDQQSSPSLRPRASTFDSTYDNMSQLKDAPTLFPSPPIIPSVPKFAISH